MLKQQYPVKPLLIVDDERDVLESYRMALMFDGLTNFILCPDPRESFGLLAANDVSLALIDLSMPHVRGEEILRHIKEKYPHVPVIVVTGSTDVDTAVARMKEGAFDYMVKPVENSRLVSSIRRALELTDLATEVENLTSMMLSEDLRCPESFTGIITASPAMHRLFKYVEAVAVSSKPVLITGESGTGKELLARAVHESSGRKGGFVAVNLGGLDDAMFSDTLFGHRRGAFTGAETTRPGLIEQAAGGTLFLDEIGDLDPGSQVKLLRLLQDREYYPLGSDVVKISDARIVAATNIDLEKKQAAGTFRTDLYYRLITHRVSLPPLRERKEDLPLLTDLFVAQAAESVSRTQPSVPDELYGLLSTYAFPGNIRELQSLIFDTVMRSEGEMLSSEPAKEYIGKNRQGQDASGSQDDGKPAETAEGRGFAINWSGRFPKLKEVEDFFIEEALRRSSGNQTTAASYLGVNQSTLSRRLKDKKEE